MSYITIHELEYQNMITMAHKLQDKLAALEEKLAEKDESLMWAKKSIERIMHEKSVLLNYLFDIDPTVNLEKVFKMQREAE